MLDKYVGPDHSTCAAHGKAITESKFEFDFIVCS